MNKDGVLCAIDVNDFDQQVVDVAASFAKQFGVDLDLIHVSISPNPDKAAWPAFIGAPHEMIRDNRLFRKISTNVEGVEIRRHHLSGFPVEQLVDFVERNEPKLLVLGTHARSGIRRILGSIAAKVMRRVSCPVMVLRQKQNSQTYSDVRSA